MDPASRTLWTIRTMWPSDDPVESQFSSDGISPAERSRSTPVVSIVLPVFNELSALPELVQRLIESLACTRCEVELVFVDDGSTDGSAEWLDQLTLADAHVVVLHLSRNFGHQAALQAGLVAATGDVLVVMDSDLQDDPRAIVRFLKQWEIGFDVVYAIRTQRKEGWLKRLLFAGFYRIWSRLAEVAPPRDAGNFGLLDRRVVQQILALPERNRFFPGLRNWVGYRQTGVPVERLARHDGTPRVSWWGLLRLAKTAVLGFSTFPLQLFSGLALLASLAAISLLLAGSVMWWLSQPVSDALVTLMIVSAFGSLNAMGLAVLGEYLIQVLDQVRGRPVYCVDRIRRHRPTTKSAGANRTEQLAPR